MARPASGKDVLAKPQEALAKAKTVEEIRQAHAVILPLEHGFSMEKVADVLGISKSWACKLRIRFIQSDGEHDQHKRKRGGRHQENMSKEEEKAFLAPFFDKAACGGIVAVSEIKQALNTRLGRKTALASTYNLLHRHNWQKLAQENKYPTIDAHAQQKCDKTSHTPLKDR
jgi:hypothetical protein